MCNPHLPTPQENVLAAVFRAQRFGCHGEQFARAVRWSVAWFDACLRSKYEQL